ncbi:MAG: glycerol-3-phosphate dehydrogenase subunit GlpB [Micropruina sp.]|nr:glycerol-3-phosphate dehydrogenase subunit GlpB [Micropruina sp.]
MSRVVVIGAGLAGLVAATRLAQGGARVVLVTKGTGGLPLSQGTIDILGYAPERVTRPLDALAGFAAANPGHPYNLLDADAVRLGVAYLRELAGPEVFVGDPEVNLQLPTAVGAIRPSAVVPAEMAAGACVDGARFLITGPGQLKDFHPQLIAENLARTQLPEGGRLAARWAQLDFPARPGESDSTGLTFARSLDDPAYRRRFAAAVRALVQPGETVGLPAVLGVSDASVLTDLTAQIGAPVFTIPLPPPSVPGVRLNNQLTAAAKAAGVRIIPGAKVIDHRSSNGRLLSVISATAGTPREYAADYFVQATGGFESGALHLDSHNVVHETVFGLPLVGADITELVHGDYWGPPQPLFKVGVGVDASMKVDGPYDNLYAVGGILAGATRWQEKSGEGIAVASAVRAADAVLAAIAATDQTPARDDATQGAQA